MYVIDIRSSTGIIKLFFRTISSSFPPLPYGSFGFEQAGHPTHLRLFCNPLFKIILRTVLFKIHQYFNRFYFEQGG